MFGFTRHLVAMLCLLSSIPRYSLDSYLPSIPAIREDLHLTSISVQWTLGYYLLGFSLSQLVYGPLSDSYGRRKPILGGLILFLMGNLLCAYSTNSTFFMMSRLISGVGAGSCAVINRAIAGDSFKGASFSKAWSYTTTSLVLTLIFAPLIGGIFEESVGWRVNFLLTSSLIVTAFLILYLYLPETLSKEMMHRLNFTTVLKNYGQILLTKQFLSGVACYTLAFSGLMVYFQLSPLLYIDIGKLSPVQYGLISLSIGLAYLLGGVLVNQTVTYIHHTYLVMLGAALAMIGGILMMILNLNVQYPLLIVIGIPSVFYVIGARIIIPNAMAASMEGVFLAKGTASALMGFIQMLGSSLLCLVVSYHVSHGIHVLALCYIALGTSVFMIMLMRYFAEQLPVRI